MDNRAIGVFDSGVGGLSVVKQLHQIMPSEDILYFGDTGRVPYGTRSAQTIQKYAAEDIAYLLKHDVKAIVAACGTVSTNVTDEQAAEYGVDIPYTGVVLPSVKAACQATKTSRIGVIATTASIRTQAYEKAAKQISAYIEVFGVACPLLVPLVENGMIEPDNQITKLVVEMYLNSLKKQNIDCLILGCTHYPLLYDIISQVMGEEVTLIDAGGQAAIDMKATLTGKDMLAQRGGKGATTYHLTDTIESFVLVAKYFLKENIIEQTKFVDIFS